MSEQQVIVIGAGIAGLTAAALLAKEGVSVTLLEAHSQPGGCAGTFCRGSYVFDVGATQVGGLEVGGIHERLFRHLGIDIPSAELLDPACVVDLADGQAPITLWHDQKLWEEERQRHFPNSQNFWSLCAELHKSNWAFSRRDPVMPISNRWDLSQLLKSLSPLNIATGLLCKLSMEDLLKLTNAQKDQRLKKYLNLQLKLYSQESVDRTAALYGATVLQIAHEPLGLWHLYGSMQSLSDALYRYLAEVGVKLLVKHRVIGFLKSDDSLSTWRTQVIDSKGCNIELCSNDIVCTLPPQCLLDLLPENLKKKY